MVTVLFAQEELERHVELMTGRPLDPGAFVVTAGDSQGDGFTIRSRGGVVTVTYKIANTGNVALNALRIRDSLGDFTGRLEQLGVGDSKTFISRVTLNEDSESAPSLEFSLASGESFTQSMDPAPIRIANGELDISFSVGRSVFENDTADAMLILTNSGDVDYSDITVLDDVYGGIIADAVKHEVKAVLDKIKGVL
jgi:hypothetical protein